MEHPGFFERAAPSASADLAAEDRRAQPGLTPIPMRWSGTSGRWRRRDADDPSFIENRKYMPQLGVDPGASLPGGAGVCSTRAWRNGGADHGPPYRGFALALQHFYPDAMRPEGGDGGSTASRRSIQARRLEEDVVVEPGAVIGREAQIGRGTRVAAGALVGYRVAIGPQLISAPALRVMHALIGDRVILHAGVRIGQDGFGFAMSAKGHLKVPQIGRSSSRTTWRSAPTAASTAGALKDTVIGEGTKIDNLVQIGHNVVMGRHCVIVGQVGISGSTELGDFVVMGGQSGRRRAHQDRVGRPDRRNGSHANRRRPGRRAHGRHAGRSRLQTWARQIGGHLKRNAIRTGAGHRMAPEALTAG